MYKILFKNKNIGTTKLENGDPPMGCVSGLIECFGSIEKFTSLVVKCGGKQQQDFLYLELNEDFDVLTEEGIRIPYLGDSITICLELDEVEIDLVGISYPEYEYLFPDRVRKYQNQFNNT